MIKRLILFVFIVLPAAALAQHAQPQMTTKAEYAYLEDFETGAVLYEKNSDKVMFPASMTKLMTVALVFEQLKLGKLTNQSTYALSENAWRKGGAPSGSSAMFIPLAPPRKEPTKVSIEELIQGIIVQSANDACIMVAEGMAGSEDAFAGMMNDYARKIGMTKSNFVNSTGLHDSRHISTAKELAILARHLMTEYPELYPYFKQKEFNYQKYKFQNRNPLVTLNMGVDGLKTGNTDESGYGLVASSVNDGRRLILVINGLEDAKDRKDEAVKLLNWGVSSFKKTALFEDGAIVGDARVWGGSKRFVKLKTDGELKVLLPSMMKDRKFKAEIRYFGPLRPPVKTGDKVADLVVTVDGGVSNRAPLYAAEDIEPAGIVGQGFDSLLLLAFGWLL
jgi:D-alanyl-D-alanine carboxypeptidase (penicillin-binding protein 5/6)